MGRRVTLAPAAWYWLGDIVLGGAAVWRYVQKHEPSDTNARMLADFEHAEVGYTKLRSEHPTALTDDAHAGLVAVLEWNLDATRLVREHPTHPDIQEAVLTRLIALDAALAQLREAPVDPERLAQARAELDQLRETSAT